MRITFLTQNDPLYILPFFEEFFRACPRELEVSAIYACRSMGNRNRSKLIKELLTLYGPLGFARLGSLQVMARIASMTGIGRVTRREYSLREVARIRSVAYHPIDNPNSPANLEAISAQAPDVLVSVACPFILKQPLLAVPKRAALNIHHAPLPRYKGMMPTFWQMYHGEGSLGITIHTMSEKLDEGEIVHQEKLPIPPNCTMHQLIRASKRRGALAMISVLCRYAQNEEPSVLPAGTDTSYFTFPTAREMKEFHARGLRAI